MCGIWSHAEWRSAITNPERPYSLTEERTNANGDVALMVEERSYWGSGVLGYWNVYQPDGRNSSFHTTPEAAAEAMNEEGFTNTTATETAAPVRVARPRRKLGGKKITAMTQDEATEFAESLSTEEAVAVQLFLTEAVPSL